MRKRIDQYTMAEFIDITCGEYECIGASDEQEAKTVATSLINQYREIATPAQAKATIVENESIIKRKTRLTLYRICLNLITAFSEYDSVVEILATTGVKMQGLEHKEIKTRIEQMIRKEEAAIKRYDEEKKAESEEFTEGQTHEQLRSSYDQQTAQLMAHFKMSIVHEQISASIYANLVNICHQQIKARQK